jgi:cytochrome c-type protein NapB
MKRQISLNILVIFSISLLFISCNSSSDDTQVNTSETGVFIDSPVEGLKYKTLTYSGFTNYKGEYQYKKGEVIKFYLGNLELGSSVGRETITPLTICGESDLNNISSKATNIARILQTLDNNSSNGTKLLIPTRLNDLDISSLNLENEADLNTILQKAQDKTSVNYVLISAENANKEMKKYIEYVVTSLPETGTVNLGACKGCHGANFEKKALGKSKIVKDMTKNEVATALVGYKKGTYGGSMKGVMKGQVARYSEEALRSTGLGQ